MTIPLARFNNIGGGIIVSTKYDVFSNKFSQDIYLQKYSMDGQEQWSDTCRRVVNAVCGQLLDTKSKEKIYNYMLERKFIPGGRYLYSSGRPFHQVNNCHNGGTKIITKTGIFQLSELENKSIEILNRFGEWETATVKAFGVQPLQKITLTDGREILATENHRWWQENGNRITTKELKEVPIAPAAPVMKINEEGIRHGIVFGDGQLDHKTQSYTYVILIGNKEELHEYFSDQPIPRKGRYDNIRFWPTKRRIKSGLKVTLQAGHYKMLPQLKDITPEYARGFIAGLIATDGSSKTSSITISCEGFNLAQDIASIAVLGGCRVKHVKVISRVNPFDNSTRELSQITLENKSAPIIRKDQITNVQSVVTPIKVLDISYSGKTEETFCVVAPKSESFTLANGLITSNCFLFRAEDSRESWAELTQKATAALMTGGGIGVDYSNLREEGAIIKRTGGRSTGPLALLNITNELGRYVMQGGQRRSAIFGSLKWSHADVFKFMEMKNHSEELKALKNKDFNFPLPMELTNISVDYDTEFFIAIDQETHPKHEHAKKVWNQNCRQAFSTAEPGMIFNFRKDNENLRNACCEVVSEDDSDKCNLGTVWMNRCSDKKEFSDVVKYGTMFLMCGGIYSDTPTQKIKEVGLKNNRIGLGLGGMHEWLMMRGMKYQVTPELHKWLSIYEQESNGAAFVTARQLNVAVPKGVRAIAPTGTIGILAETTTGIEPLFCKAYLRRYYKDSKWLSQYVVDGSVKRLLDKGIKIEDIQDSYDLTFQQRVKFQADVQNYVDMAISSTCNMSSWGSEENNEQSLEKNSEILLKYAKRLRGFTAYPDGCRGGQPLTRVSLQEAMEKEGTVFEEHETNCLNGVCGI